MVSTKHLEVIKGNHTYINTTHGYSRDSNILKHSKNSTQYNINQYYDTL